MPDGCPSSVDHPPVMVSILSALASAHVTDRDDILRSIGSVERVEPGADPLGTARDSGQDIVVGGRT